MGQIRGWAFGLLKIPREEFYSMRQGEFWEAMHAYSMDKQADRQHIGELTRGLCVRIVNLFVKKSDRFNDARKFWPMPWDERETELNDTLRELSKMSPAERKAIAEDFLKKIDTHGD